MGKARNISLTDAKLTKTVMQSICAEKMGGLARQINDWRFRKSLCDGTTFEHDGPSRAHAARGSVPPLEHARDGGEGFLAQSFSEACIDSDCDGLAAPSRVHPVERKHGQTFGTTEVGETHWIKLTLFDSTIRFTSWRQLDRHTTSASDLI